MVDKTTSELTKCRELDWGVFDRNQDLLPGKLVTTFKYMTDCYYAPALNTPAFGIRGRGTNAMGLILSRIQTNPDPVDERIQDWAFVMLAVDHRLCWIPLYDLKALT
jgi:hypothetical protein